eukprot:1161543-Pelagomonas_calceolata.AAC.3
MGWSGCPARRRCSNNLGGTARILGPCSPPASSRTLHNHAAPAGMRHVKKSLQQKQFTFAEQQILQLEGQEAEVRGHKGRLLDQPNIWLYNFMPSHAVASVQAWLAAGPAAGFEMRFSAWGLAQTIKHAGTSRKAERT